MKVFKASGIIWFLVVLVVGYAYFFEYKGKKEQELQEQEQKKVFTVEPDDIKGFTLKNAKGTAQVEDENDIWNVKEPYKDEADITTVHSFLQSLLDEKFEEVVAEGEGIDLALYGLNENSTFVEIRSEKKNKKIYLGSVSALANKKYISIEGENKILLVNGSWEALLNRDPSEFRKKDIVDVPIRTITKIEFIGKNKMTFVSDNLKWKIEEFKTDDLDPKEVESYIGALMNLRASQFVSDKKTTKNKALEVRIYKNSGDPTIIDIFEPEGGLSQVISNQRDIGFKISATVSASLNKVLDDFRDRKRPLKFDKDTITKIKYVSDLVSLDIKKQGSTWVWNGEGENKLIDSAQVDRLLSKLSNIKVKAFLGKDIPFQKSGLITLDLSTDAGSALKLEWSPRIVKDFFITKSSLWDEYFGLLATDIQELPIQTLIQAPPPVPKVELPKAEFSNSGKQEDSK